MRQLTYTDTQGRIFLVELPDGVPDSEAADGIPIGPPDVVDHLGLPEPFATRMHNQLAQRKLWRFKDVQRNPGALQGALMAALKVDVQRLYSAYLDLEHATPEPDPEGR